jgi:hypothetical protein
MADEKDIGQLAKAYEAILKAAEEAVRQAAEEKAPEAPPAEETRPKPREILFRGGVYVFKPIGPGAGPSRRNGVVERWQADIHGEDGGGFNVVVDEFYDGRYTPWAFDGMFFNDFMQAAIVGLVTGTFEARWHQEQWRLERLRQRFMFIAVPGIILVTLAVGILIGLRHG